MKADTLGMHYTIARPADYDIAYTVTLPNYDSSSYVNQGMFLENQRKILTSIDPEQLTPEDALSHELLINSMNQQMAGQEFPFYSEPLSPGSGMVSQLPILLAEYYFLDKRDVEDYLALLSCIPSYFSSIEDYERTRARSGLFMPAYSSEKIIRQCSSILTPESIRDHSHFLMTTFQDRIEKLSETAVLTSAEMEAYTSENKRILLEYVIPSYQKLSNTVKELQASSQNENGLCYYPKGREYYEYLVKQTTGSAKTIPEIKSLLQEQLRKDYTELIRLYDSLKGCGDSSPIRFPFQDPSLMLQDLETRMKKAFPPLTATTDFIPACTVKKVSPSLADYVSPAFYLTPPIDHMDENSIYINEKSILDDLELYTTLAHEGYPGHLYQTLSFQQLSFPDPVRNLLFYGGYTEGWALYTENYSYDYAKELLRANTSHYNTSTDAQIDLYRCSRDLQLCMYSILDIGIHYDGLKYEEVYSMLAEFGITDEETARNIYEYIVEEPANYLKYYLGYLEILETKASYKKISGSHYSEISFHKNMLELGPMDFETLRKHLNQ
ncbi:MAG: DUF885 domain-containing protein [Lachnospiraceae bacterium]|nr:DUF885 domain-containing protein [Lachnospiraceae bacterium]